MTLSLIDEKKNRMKTLASDLLANNSCSVRIVARFIGTITASFEAVPGGMLHYRYIERCKIRALKECKGDYVSPCSLSDKTKTEIKLWIENISNSFAYMKYTPNIDYVIYTDVSNLGWGASDRKKTINGRWSLEEQGLHINCLETLAINFAVYTLLYLKLVRIMSDNRTAISYINKQGGTHSMMCNDIAVDIWEICIGQGVHISAAHIVHNVLADKASRNFEDASEWTLSTSVFSFLTGVHGTP